MRPPKISLKKYFYLTLIFALLLIFGFSLREREEWKWKTSSPQQQSVQNQQHHLKSHANSHHYDKESGESYGEAEAGGGGDNDGERHVSKSHKLKKADSAVRTATTTTTAAALLNAIKHQPRRDSDSEQQGLVTSLPWFFKNGQYYPQPGDPKGGPLFPYQDSNSDRIVNQLMFVPRNYDNIRASGKLKTILLYNGLGPWYVKAGRDVFLRSKCPVNTCEITANRDRAMNADLILYKDHYIPTGIRRPANNKQLHMLYHLECPYHTQNIKVPDAINLTATYRRDSDIVAPYEKWVYYDARKREIDQDRNFALNKTKKVAWFVSNCGARNGRLQFAHELQKYIEVDIYGACGNYKCSRNTAGKCFEILDNDYKFYLAFENSNCRDYITEKFFVNSLNRNILPIVMGARPEDYQVSAPHRSYIHVDEFESPRELAEYLLVLDKDDILYNSYFKWKGTGEFINTFYWCRVCAMLHDEESLRKPRWYGDFNNWWRGPGVCTSGSWRNFKARKDVITDD